MQLAGDIEAHGESDATGEEPLEGGSLYNVHIDVSVKVIQTIKHGTAELPIHLSY